MNCYSAPDNPFGVSPPENVLVDSKFGSRSPKHRSLLLAGGIGVLSCLFYGGCADKKPPASLQTTTATSSVSSLGTCRSKVIDYGQKGTVAAVSRGTYSDTKLIPGSAAYPAIAYVDTGALGVKFAYWQDSDFQIEAVSGDGTAAFVRLAFLSTGVPLVFWTQGGNLKVAMRSTAPPQSGTWSAGVIDTGTAPRAVEVSVNPLDQVAVGFLTDTAVAGRPKFSYCNNPCTTPSGFVTMTPNPYIENTNLVAAQVSMGMGWCKASASTYYPAVVYSVTGITRYAICQNALTNCLSSTNWTTQTIVATGNLSSKLHLDATVVGDVPKVVSLGAAGIVPYKMGVTACTAPPVAFSAGSAMGTATSGNHWMSILKDVSGFFHLLANESTTSVRYYNSTTTNFTGAWNIQGTIDTTTLAAAEAGGADIDTTNIGIYLSYGLNTAPFSIRLGRVSDYTVASNSALFSRYDIDLTGDIQLSAANSQQRNIAMGRTSGGRPAVAYIDFSVGAAANAKLKYAFRDGDSSADWNVVLVPGTANPQFPGMAFDASNRPWISYFEASFNRFYLVTNTLTDGTGSWRSYEFPSIPGGAPIALPAANNTAVTMYQNSGVTKPIMITIDNNAGTKGVRAAMLNPTLNTWSAVSTLDTLGAGLGAAHLSADSDSLGNVVVAYQDLNTARARYVYSSNGTTWTSSLAVSAVNQGMGVSVRLNPSSHSPTMSYFDRVNNTVYYAPCSGTPASCATGGWTPAAIEMTAGVSGLAAGNEQLLSVALTFNSKGEPIVVYPRGQGATGHLTVATKFTSAFSSSTLAEGVNGALAGSSALNFSIGGWGNASVLNSSNSITSVYLAPLNWLSATSCGD